MGSALALSSGLLVVACGGETARDGVALGGSSASEGGGPGTGGASGVAGSLGCGGGWSGDGVLPISTEQHQQIVDAACVRTSWVTEPVNVGVTFVVDASESMNEPSREDPALSKWQAVREQLLRVLDELSPYAAVGLLLFPNQATAASSLPQPAEACVNTAARIPPTELGALGSPARALLAERLNAVTPAGATPTLDAYRFALHQDVVPHSGEAPQRIVLVTDGSPTLAGACLGDGSERSRVESGPLVAEVQEALVEHAVKTLVVGVPGPDEPGAEWLSEAAIAGGLPACVLGSSGACYHTLGSLRAGLSTISATDYTCDFVLSEPVNLEHMAVMLTLDDGDTLLLPRVCGGECTAGYRLRPGPVLQLCPAQCDAAVRAQRAVLELTGGC